jgi:vacuolar-type H+-ATPase subunit I/STV1
MCQTGQTEAKELATNQVTNGRNKTIRWEQEMASDDSAAGNLSGHRQAMGVCWIVYGIFRLIMGVCLVLYSGTATVMFGALLGRVPDAFSLMADFHIFYAAIVVLSFVCGLFGLFAGLALLANQGSARKLALVAAILSVSDLPFGTTLGIFTLIALLPLRGGLTASRA